MNTFSVYEIESLSVSNVLLRERGVLFNENRPSSSPKNHPDEKGKDKATGQDSDDSDSDGPWVTPPPLVETSRGTWITRI